MYMLHGVYTEGTMSLSAYLLYTWAYYVLYITYNIMSIPTRCSKSLETVHGCYLCCLMVYTHLIGIITNILCIVSH